MTSLEVNRAQWGMTILMLAAFGSTADTAKAIDYLAREYHAARWLCSRRHDRKAN